MTNTPSSSAPSVPPQLAFIKDLRRDTHPFAAFMVMPSKTHFDTQDPDEVIYVLVRRHAITNVKWILGTLVLFVLPVIIPFDLVFQNLPLVVPQNFMLILSSLWYLAVFGIVILNFLDWYFNVGIVTSKRVLDVDFHGLLVKEFTQALLPKIEDVTATSGGVFRDIFNYGDVHVQTAGNDPNIEFLAIPRPQEIIRIIISLISRS